VSCPICEKRKSARFCPAKGEKICAVCCGTEREVTIDCPSDCSYLVAAHRYEDEHRRSLPANTPLLDEKIPQDIVYTAELARRIRTPLALGESYRTRYELAAFFRERALGFVQPDLGRCGINLNSCASPAVAAESGVPVVPHLSIAMGPQIAAAIHFAAAIPNCELLEYNPNVLEMANRF